MANALIYGTAPGATSVQVTPEAPDTRVWMYRTGEDKIFNSAGDVPPGEGWVDSPALVIEAVNPEPALQPEKPKRKAKTAETDEGGTG